MAATETTTSQQAQPARNTSHVLPAWHASLALYREPSPGKSLWQLLNTLLPYFGLW